MQILLLTDIPPCTNYTAGLVQKQLCEFLFEEGHDVGCVSIVDPSLKPDIPNSIKQRLSVFISYNKPSEGYGRKKFGAINSFIFNGYNRNITLPYLSSSISNELNKSKIKFDLIWSVIQGQTMICLVPNVARNLGLDYVAEVWDPPEWWLDENRFDSYSYRKVMEAFRRLLKNAKCCLAASHNMAKEYKEKYSAVCIPVIPSLEANSPSIKKSNNNEFHIGYSGQIYSKKEFSSFIDALDSIGWNYNGKRIILNVFTDYIDPDILKQHPNIKSSGWIPQEELLNRLSCMDLCYCPYRFDKYFEVIARLSFPSKLTSYLKSGVPVLVHAPEYSSISSFIQDGVTGYVCNSTNVDTMVEKLKIIISDSDRERIGMMGYQLFLKFLTNETMKKSFYKSLGMCDTNYENYTDK
ncbi:glycosyltransferase [uncultured Phascolarctobacterium sp.]|uniref:glycosyltransferase n=1 Tax=uncultured Phascolarctobacterium sp. TaxID=512296 RepID=UPI00263777AC|nr:glycosyltransferase [uncultured Phascolarctobacterium sp.]